MKNEPPILKPNRILTGKSCLHSLYDIFIVGRTWELTQDYKFITDEGITLILPKGFTSNAANIPRLFRGLCTPAGILLIPSLFHDFGYDHNYIWRIDKNGKKIKYMKGAGKKYWDNLLGKLVKQVTGSKSLSWLTTIVLYAFGGPSWRLNNSSNISRVIARIQLFIRSIVGAIVALLNTILPLSIFISLLPVALFSALISDLFSCIYNFLKKQ